MRNDFTPTNKDTFRSLFRGREDIFAIRWEKSGKSGYMPAYQYAPYHYQVHKRNGGHVWIFFDKPYPAIRSRKIFISILEQSGVFSMFDNSSSFDRLFQIRIFFRGKGLGNLIALPFFEPAMENGNSCFINPETFEPYPEQWLFLNEIERVSIEVLDNLFKEISTTQNQPIPKNHNSKLSIVLQQNIRIQRDGLITPLINFLKEELNFANSDFFIKKKSGKNTFGTERYFKLVEETENEVIIPRRFIGKLLRFHKEQNLDFDFQDNRKLKEEISYLFKANLRSHQEKVFETAAKKDFGVIVAPPGSGKTIIGLKIIADKKTTCLNPCAS